MSEIKDMGVEFVEALRCIADVLKAADHGNYIGNSLTIDITQQSERHLKTMYELSVHVHFMVRRKWPFGESQD